MALSPDGFTEVVFYGTVVEVQDARGQNCGADRGRTARVVCTDSAL